MFEVKMRFRTIILLWAAVLIFTWTTPSYAQDTAPPSEDPIEQLRLTPEQRQRIRMIVEQTKTERQITSDGPRRCPGSATANENSDGTANSSRAAARANCDAAAPAPASQGRDGCPTPPEPGSP